MSKSKDTLFSSPMQRNHKFDFGIKTVDVFDDMLHRSIPFYGEIQNMIVELATTFISNNPVIYDLGCSTGTTLLLLSKTLAEKQPKLIGVDASQPMLDKAKSNIVKLNPNSNIEFKQADLNEAIDFLPADIMIMNLTLQFIKPDYRGALIKNIYTKLKRGGALILIEKVIGEVESMNSFFMNHYHAYKKRKGYSDLEIAQKRDALEDVLIPYRLSDNINLLKQQGFDSTEVFFRWYNFVGVIAIKA